LDKDIGDSEICPTPERSNKKTGEGVVHAIKNEYNSEHVAELDTDCEIVWAKMNLKGNGTIYICSYYRRNVSDEDLSTFPGLLVSTKSSVFVRRVGWSIS
jgi:hypothetical protein